MLVIIIIQQFQQRWRYKVQISLIVAMDENRVIGKNNQIPWHLPADLKRFRKLTMNKHVIMGRKTYESIGKPLLGRHIIVVTRDKKYIAEGCMVVNSINDAFFEALSVKEIIVAGGSEIYEQSLFRANIIYLTKIHEEFEGDSYFPVLNFKDWNIRKMESFSPDEKNSYSYTFYTLERMQLKLF